MDSTRIQDVLSQIERLSAADMKNVARFGKVKDYSPEYKDLKEALRSFFTLAKNVYGVDMGAALLGIEDIRFTGMIPNDVFNAEKARVLEIGERLLKEVQAREARPVALPAPSAAASVGVAGAANSADAFPRIYLSASRDAELLTDVKRCLITADFDVHEADGPGFADPEYSPLAVASQMRACEGAVICLLSPTAEDIEGGQVGSKPSNVTKIPRGRGRLKRDVHLADETDETPSSEPVNATEQLATLKARVVQNALAELGVAVGRFPDRTFFLVSKDLADALPDSMKGLVGLQMDGDALSFDDGQMLIRVFRSEDWSAQS